LKCRDEVGGDLLSLTTKLSSGRKSAMKYSEYLKQTESFPIASAHSCTMPNCDVVMEYGEVTALLMLLKKHNLTNSGEWADLPWLELVLCLARDHVADFPFENRGRDADGHFKFWVWAEVEIIKRSKAGLSNEKAFLELSDQTERDREFRSVDAIRIAYYRYKSKYNPEADKQRVDKMIDSHLRCYSGPNVCVPALVRQQTPVSK